MPNYKILTDQDVKNLLSMKDVIEAVELGFKAKATNSLISPPRFHVDTDKGSLVFTAGAETKARNVIGFRVYDSFHSPNQTSTNKTQLVSVFDSQTGDFKGVVIGSAIGSMRTGALGGVAIKYMSNPDSHIVGILGSGFQARTQLEAACAVRKITTAKIFSPNQQNRELFAKEMSKSLGINVKPVNSAETAVRDVDILICATSSTAPTFNSNWLKPGVHINTLGPKLKSEHEISVETAQRSTVISTDSLDQLNAYNPPYFLKETPEMGKVVDLSEIVAGHQANRNSTQDITLFLSVGLAGTEVLVADEAIRRAE